MTEEISDRFMEAIKDIDFLGVAAEVNRSSGMTGMATIAQSMIEGVELLPLETHIDSRGFFREVLQVGHLDTGFGQWSHSMMYAGTIKAWHYHQLQTDYWYVPVGVVRAVVCDTEGVTIGSLVDDPLYCLLKNIS